MPTLHIHFDEAGNWEFSPKGSRHFVLAAAWTYNPAPLANLLRALRFKLVKNGQNIDAFHASPDKQGTRNLVVEALLRHENWGFASVVIEKRKVNPVLREPQKFYPKFASVLLRFILRGSIGRQASRVLIFTDTLPMDTRAKREGVLKAMKTTCSAELADGCSYYVFSHRLESNKWLQVADYCCWAIWKKWEHEDTRTYELLKARLAAPELNLTAQGDGTIYY